MKHSSSDSCWQMKNLDWKKGKRAEDSKDMKRPRVGIWREEYWGRKCDKNREAKTNEIEVAENDEKVGGRERATRVKRESD